MSKTYLFSICLLILLTGSNSFAQKSPKTKTPNVIIILADDLGWGDIGGKNQRISTPNLDRLASGGMRLTNFHASSSLCSPTRAALMTGRYPHSVGVPDLASPEARGDVPVFGLSHEAVTIPEALKPMGYRSMLGGKWHLGFYKENWPRTHGFDEFWGSLIGTPRFWDVKESYHNEDSVKVDKYFTDWITDKSIDFIKQDKNKPFFLYLAYNAPHYPLEAPEPLIAKYKAKFPEDGLYANYAAMVEQMDNNIGRVLDELDRLGIADNTLIMFTSDNGPSAEPASYGLPGAKISRGPYKGHKFSMYEGGLKVPFIARWPGKIPKGVVRDDLAITMDLLPTVLQAAGARSIPKEVDGKSIVPLLMNQSYTRKQTLHWENIYNLAVQKNEWKLVYQFWEKEPHLYKISTDPLEQNDVAKDHPAVVKELMDDHANWVKTRYPNPIPRMTKRPVNRIPLK